MNKKKYIPMCPIGYAMQYFLSKCDRCKEVYIQNEKFRWDFEYYGFGEMWHIKSCI